MKLTKELVRLMEEYNASDLGELIDILPDLDFEEDYEDEDELPQQEEVDLADYFLTYKEPAVLGDVSCPFASFPFNN